MSEEKQVLDCLLCTEKYSLKDAEKGLYFLETRICKNCYRKAAKTERRLWCFGKKQKDNKPGFSKKNVVCQQICPDRNICKQFIKGEK